MMNQTVHIALPLFGAMLVLATAGLGICLCAALDLAGTLRHPERFGLDRELIERDHVAAIARGEECGEPWPLADRAAVTRRLDEVAHR